MFSSHFSISHFRISVYKSTSKKSSHTFWSETLPYHSNEHSKNTT